MAQNVQIERALHEQALRTIDQMQADLLQSMNKTMQNTNEALVQFQGNAAVAQTSVNETASRTAAKFSQYHVALVDTMNKVGQSFYSSVDQAASTTNTQSGGALDQAAGGINTLPGLG